MYTDHNLHKKLKMRSYLQGHISNLDSIPNTVLVFGKIFIESFNTFKD